jgi:hypothetical protein
MFCICTCTAATRTIVIIQRTVPDYYIVQGRADDLMIIGRIKVEHPPLDVFSKLSSPMHFMKPN